MARVDWNSILFSSQSPPSSVLDSLLSEVLEYLSIHGEERC